MINVNELKALRKSQTDTDIYIENLGAAIKKRDQEGHRNIVVDIPFTVEVSTVKQQLQAAGYDVKYRAGEEGRGFGLWQGGRWQQFKISWE